MHEAIAAAFSILLLSFGVVIAFCSRPSRKTPSKSIKQMASYQAVLAAARDKRDAWKRVTKKALDAEIRFVKFSTFKELGSCPRFGNLVQARNRNVCKPYSEFDRQETAFIFVSHRWLTPKPGGAGHPDDAIHRKHALIVAACERLRGPRAPVPEEMHLALWLDYACVVCARLPACISGRKQNCAWFVSRVVHCTAATCRTRMALRPPWNSSSVCPSSSGCATCSSRPSWTKRTPIGRCHSCSRTASKTTTRPPGKSTGCDACCVSDRRTHAGASTLYTPTLPPAMRTGARVVPR